MQPPINPATGAPIARVAFKRSGAHLTASVLGEIDRSSAAAVSEAIEQETQPEDDALIMVMSGVTFCDSSAIRMILNLRHSAEEAGRTFTVSRPSRQVLRTFTICGADAVLTIEP